jgi:hydroxypyruvate reductase/glycerate 2-kinase
MPPARSDRDLADDALAVWRAGVDAVRPGPLLASAWPTLPAEVKAGLAAAPRVFVVGAGKAGTGMAAALEAQFGAGVNRLNGLVNVPEGTTRPLARIRLHPARPAGSNHPTAAGVAGADEMLALLASAGPEDVAICLLSGGGSALLPAPGAGITLDDKQTVTKLLHACGATIREMNAVRKHLSRVKGGRLARAFRGKRLVTLIISDVVGDPLDVIASGPTAPDPTTFADSVAVLDKYGLTDRVPAAVLELLRAGLRGEIPETPKTLPPAVSNVIIGSNATALAAATGTAAARGYRVLDLGPFVEGETKEVAVVLAGIVRSIRGRGEPVASPACVLVGGETTVTLGPNPGKGGRNQEFVLAVADKLGDGMAGVCVLSGGTDGEDGPTDAAGAVATAETLARAAALGLDPADHLRRHDAYPFFDATGGLVRTGLTGTNVMDVRVILVR